MVTITRLSYLTCAVLLFMLAGCTTVPSPGERTGYANALAAAQGWVAENLDAGHFVLRTYRPAQSKGGLLTIYLEGDGLAWLTSTLPSTDPTPVNPLALQLALAQPSGEAAYLARPCQFIRDQTNCSARYWTDARFAREVITSTNQAVDQLKTRLGAKELVLVGYSGGGTVALLLAAERKDVRQVITVAGNLDHAAWTALHRLKSLYASDNPVRYRMALQSIPQIHLTGERDHTIPSELVLNFNSGYPPGTPSQVMVLPGYDHGCCWVAGWPELWRQHSRKDQER